MTTALHPIAFDLPHRVAAMAFATIPGHAAVSILDGRLVATYGPWRVESDVDNIASVSITGPYSFLKTAGPPHLSLRDGGISFAGTGGPGVCLEFHRPVRGIEPLGLLRHRGLTVTVADPEALVAQLEALGVRRGGVLAPAQEQVSEDALHTATTSTLRRLASERGIEGATSLSHQELVDALEPQIDPELAEELDDA
jgi:hypothetical protein